jgi:DNA repair protein RecO (recombination protein O)
MAIQRTQAVVTRRQALGESDRLVEFYTRDFGKVRGVARSARRPRSRFGSALELLTLGELVFFETPRSELVRIDHFDIVEPFVAVREHLERLGHGAWALECVTRLSADRDPHPALFRLVVRDLRALARARRPAWVSTCFALRAVDLLGQRPRIDRCLSCHRPYPFAEARLDVAAGGLVCGGCAVAADAMAVSGAALGALKRLRELRWDEALRLTLADDLEHELGAVTEGLIARLAGQHPRSTRFLGQLRRPLGRVAESPAPRVP